MDHIWGKPLWLQDNLLYWDMFWQRTTARMFLLYPLVGNLLRDGLWYSNYLLIFKREGQLQVRWNKSFPPTFE